MSHREAFRSLLCALFFFFGICPLSHGDPVVAGMTLVSEKRVSRTLFDYTYRATVANQGPKVTNVLGTLSSVSPNTTVLDGVISVGDIEENSSALSVDTFTIRHDRRYPFDQSTLLWQMTWGTIQQPEVILEGTITAIGPEGGSVSLPGFAAVTFTKDQSRLPLDVRLEKILAPDMSNAFADDRQEAGPAMPEILRIHSTGSLATPVAACIFVPSSFASGIPPQHQVELFAEFVQSSDQELSITTFEQLGASFDPQTGKACATLPPYAFKPVSSVVAHIIVGSYPYVTSQSQATAANFTPAGTVVTTPTATIAVAGDLVFTIPPVLDQPLAGALVPSSPFGVRVHPITQVQSMHFGVDLAANGVDVLAAADGNVTRNGAQVPCLVWTNGVCKTGYGHRVYVTHVGASGNSVTRYAHLDPNGMAALGQVMSQARIGVEDNSGSSTGPHLHFEYRPGGIAVDPMQFIGVGNAAQYLQSLSVVTKIDGNPIQSSRQPVAAETFHYNANIDLSQLALSPGNHTISVHVENQSGLGTSVHTATLDLSQPTLQVTLNGSGKGAVTSVPQGIVCAVVANQPGPSCSAPYAANTPVVLTAGAVPGAVFTGWGGDCAAGQNTSPFTVTMDSNKNCSATFTVLPLVRLNPFGNWNLSNGPFYAELTDSSFSPTTTTNDVTVTLLRQVFSQCRGLLFSSNRVVIIPQNQSLSSDLAGYVAGRDPFCNTLPIRTELTITAATLGANTALDLNSVPAAERRVAITR